MVFDVDVVLFAIGVVDADIFIITTGVLNDSHIMMVGLRVRYKVGALVVSYLSNRRLQAVYAILQCNYYDE